MSGSTSYFARFVRDRREALGLTADAVGHAAGLSGDAVRLYERAQNSPRAVRLGPLARALGVDAHELLDAVLADEAHADAESPREPVPA